MLLSNFIENLFMSCLSAFGIEISVDLNGIRFYEKESKKRNQKKNKGKHQRKSKNKIGLRSKFKRIILFLPKALSHRLIRSKVKLNYDLPPQLSFKIAETESEFEQAFKLIYKLYLEADITKKNSSSMRATFYHALPSTSVLIAKWENKVVGTVSIIKDSSLGLPVDKILNLSQLKNTYKKIGEVSSFAIDKDFKNKTQYISMPLFKYLYEISRDYLGIEVLVATSNKIHGLFYEAVFGYNNIKGKLVKNYDFANGKEAEGRYSILNKENFGEFIFNKYSHCKKENNLFKYFFEYENKNAIFPERKYFITSFNNLNKSCLERFFYNQPEIFNQLTTLEIRAIFNNYNRSELQNCPPSIDFLSQDTPQRSPRYDVEFKGTMCVNDSLTSAVVQSASQYGCQIWTTAEAKVGEKVFLNIEPSSNRVTKVHGVVCWVNSKKVGVQITQSSGDWDEFIKNQDINTSYDIEERIAS